MAEDARPLPIYTQEPLLREFVVTLDSLSTPEIHRLAEYWRNKRGPSGWCRKSAIDPAEIKHLLPQLVIAEIQQDPLRVRYRLVGTAIADFYGEITGMWLHERAVIPEYRADAERFYRMLLETGQPVFGSAEYSGKDGLKRYEWAFFPLSEDEQHVTHALYIEEKQKHWVE